MRLLPHTPQTPHTAPVTGRAAGFLRRAACAAVAAIAIAVAAVPPARCDEALARGDALYAEKKGGEARAEWLQGLEKNPTDIALLCRLARVESELSEDEKGEARRQLVMSAVGYARAAVKAAPDSAQPHVWLAASLGRQAMQEGPKTRLALSKEIKAEADRAIALDPGIGRAWHVRALWNRGVASLNMMERAVANTVLGGVPKGATMENAVTELEKAIELEPRYLNHHLELARTYVMMKRKDEALPHLEQVLALPPETSLRDPQYQAAARELLAKIKKD